MGVILVSTSPAGIPRPGGGWRSRRPNPYYRRMMARCEKNSGFLKVAYSRSPAALRASVSVRKDCHQMAFPSRHSPTNQSRSSTGALLTVP